MYTIAFNNGPSINNVTVMIFFSYSHDIARKSLSWKKLFRCCSGLEVDNVLAIIDLLLSLPPTSVANEKAFSQLKYIKSDRRGRLSQQNLNNAMIVRLEGPPIATFDPETAVDHFMASSTICLQSNMRLTFFTCDLIPNAYQLASHYCH